MSACDVCVVVPTLGRRLDWLEACLRSVAAQGVSTELRIVSPDSEAVRAMARRFGATWIEERGTGLSSALNQGLANVHCPYAAWLGDDDLLAGGSLARSVAALRSHPTSAMTYGRIACIDSEGRELFKIRPGRFAKFWMRVGHDFVPQPGSVFRTSALHEVGPVDESLGQAMDLDLFIRLSRKGSLMYLPVEVASFRRHEGSITVANPTPGLEARTVRRKYMSDLARAVETVAFPLINLVGRAWAKGFKIDSRIRHS